jgi:hypothetical protein
MDKIKDIEKQIKEEKLAIKEHNTRLNNLRDILKEENKKINEVDEIIDSVPLTNPQGKIIAMAFYYKSGILVCSIVDTYYTKRWK